MFKTCLFRTGRWLGLCYRCLQLSPEPLIPTTSHSKRRFLVSWAMPNISGLSFSSSVLECTVASDGERAVPSMPFGSVTVTRGPLTIDYTLCTCGGCNALLINGPVDLKSSHSTLHFLGSSAVHPPFCVKSMGWTVVEKKSKDRHTETPSFYS